MQAAGMDVHLGEDLVWRGGGIPSGEGSAHV